MRRCHQFLSGFLAKTQLSRVSRLSDNYKGDNEIQGAVHTFPSSFLKAEENPTKPQLGDRMMKAVRPVIASNGFQKQFSLLYHKAMRFLRLSKIITIIYLMH